MITDEGLRRLTEKFYRLKALHSLTLNFAKYANTDVRLLIFSYSCMQLTDKGVRRLKESLMLLVNLEIIELIFQE